MSTLFNKKILLQDADIIRYEDKEAHNTAERVGRMFVDIINAIDLSLGGTSSLTLTEVGNYLTNNHYLTQSVGDGLYQPKGNYALASALGNYYTKPEIDTKITALNTAIGTKLDKSVFDDLFEKIQVGGQWVIRAKYGLYSNQFISALGLVQGDLGGGTGTGGSLFGLMRSWPSVDPGPSTQEALGANLGWELRNRIAALETAGFATQNWVLNKNYLTAHQDISHLLSKTEAASLYQPKGNYLTSHQSLAHLLSKTEAASLYQPKGNYLTGITKAMVEAVLTGTITTHNHDSRYYTEAEIDTKITALNTAIGTKLDKSVFDDLFEKIQVGGQWVIRAKYGFYSNQFISALGLVQGNLGGGSGTGGSLFGLMRSWPSVDPGPSTQEALGANLGWELRNRIAALETAGFATQNWVLNKNYLTTHQDISHLLSKTEAASMYQPKGNYALASALENYYTKTEINTKLTDGSVTKVGTATVGASNWPIYLNNGVPYACAWKFGNYNGAAAVNNGTLNENLNADMLDGHHKNEFNAVARFGTTAMPTSGYYKVKIKSATSWMLGFKILAYQNYCFDEINISGYNYGNSHWYLPSATLVNSQGNNKKSSIAVTFGYDSAWNLWVAIPAACYAGISVTDVVNGYNQVADPHSLFEIVYEDTLTGTVQGTHTATCHALLTDNVASASRLQTTGTYTAWGQTYFANGVPQSVSGNMTGVGIIKFSAGNEIAFANSRFCFGATNQTAAQGVNVGSLLVSNAWADYTKVPVNGIYIKGALRIGDITIEEDMANGGLKISGGVYATKYVSALGLVTGNLSGGSSGGGTAYDRLDAWADYTTDKAGYVLSAGLGADLNSRVGANATSINSILSRLNSLEGGGTTSVQVTGSGNAITDISKGGTAIIATKGATFLTQHQSLANYVTLNTAQTITGAKTFSAELKATNKVTFLSEGKLKIWNVASTRNSILGNEMVFVQTSIDRADPETSWPDKNRNDLFLQPKGGHVHIGPIEVAQNNTLYVAGDIKATSGITAASFIRSDGTSTQFLMADGSTVSKVSVSDVSHTGWGGIATDDLRIPTMTFLALWNGAYNTNGASNLQYCYQGRFGDIVTQSLSGLDSRYVNNAGDTMTGELDIQMNGHKLRLWHDNYTRIQSDVEFVFDKRIWANGTSPNVNNTYSCGEPSYRWSNVYATTINVTSTGLVSNLNADLLDGKHYSQMASGGHARYTPAGPAAGRWIRIAKSNTIDNGSIDTAYAIISLTNSYYNTTTQGITFAVYLGYRSGYTCTITQLGGCGGDLWPKVRIVYPTAANTAYYIEVYYNTTSILNEIGVEMTGSFNMELYDTYTAGEIPTGYAAKEQPLTVGMSAERFTSSVPTGTAPLTVASTTLVSNLNADMLDGLHSTSFGRAFGNSNIDANDYNSLNGLWGGKLYNATNVPYTCYAFLHFGWGQYYGQFNAYNNQLQFRAGSESNGGPAWKTVAFTDSNVASATKLQTARTLWGQSFDGTGNVSGNLTGVGSINTAASPIGTIYASDWFRSTGNSGWYSQTYGGGIYMTDANWVRAYNNKGFRVQEGVAIGVMGFKVGLKLHGALYEALEVSAGNYSMGLGCHNNGSWYWWRGTANPEGSGNKSYVMLYDGDIWNFTGKIFATAGVWSDGFVSALGRNDGSDERLKTITGDAELPIETILNAPAKRFVWNALTGETMVGRRAVGTLAQYWAKHLPETVNIMRNGYLGLDYAALDWVAIHSTAQYAHRGLTDHEERIRNLESENKKLRAELNGLKARLRA